MNDPKVVGDMPLIEEANREAWKKSLFWKNDHPATHSLGNSAPPAPETYAELVAGAKLALEQARVIGRLAEKRLREEGFFSGQAADGARAEIRQFMVNAMLGVIRADSQRARSEFRHWREYIAWAQSKVDEPPPKTAGIVGKLVRDRGGAAAAVAELEEAPF